MTEYELVTDQDVDAIDVCWNTDPNHLLTKVVSNRPLPKVLEGFLTVSSWLSVGFFAEGAAVRGDRASNYSGFRFPEGLDSDEEPFDGVQVFDYYNKIVMSEAAFMRMMCGLFQTLRDGAKQQQLPVLNEDWWPAFVESAAQVEERVSTFSASPHS